ncbi:MAG: DUF4360 domain-containing protein [Pseudobdellovibrionaceae bacterium]
MKTMTVSMLGLALILISAFAAEAKDLSSLKVTGVTYAGSGCPQGSVQTVFSPDAGQFSILYNSFSLNVGGATLESTDTRGCEVSINLKLPFGYAINVESADFRGFVALDGGVIAQHTVDHKVGSNKLATYGFGTQIFTGPTQENYFIRSEKPKINLPKLVQCLPLKQNTTLMVRTRVKMTGGDGPRQGLMTVDSADGQIEQRYVLSLRRCF